MPLQTVHPPMPAHEAVRSRLGYLAEASAFRTPALRGVAPNTIALSTPHRVAILPLDRIKRGMSLRSAAQKKGWRFLVHNGDQVVAAAQSTLSEKGEHRFAHLNEGPFVAGTEQAVRRAELLASVQKGRFEPLLLMVPAVNVVALWLQDLDGDADLVMAIPPVPREIPPYKALAASDFVTVLIRLAGRVPPDAGGRDSPKGG
jgi:hypothetical protein